MKTQSPARIFIPANWARLSTALLIALSATARGGDLLRGGGGFTGPAAPAPSAGGNEAGGVQAAQARANAADALARTSQAIAAVQQLQIQARTAAAAQNNAGAGLPNVPNGLGIGGLHPTANATGWTGANAPTQGLTETGKDLVTIKQVSQQALLKWDTFNVGRNTDVYFDQTLGGASRNQWIAFNTINDPSGVPSQILGSIRAEGQVYVINQNGIIFGGASEVNTHTLVASSLPLNENLVSRGLLNNPDAQFLFSSLPQPAGPNGTPSVTPPAPKTAGGRIGDVVVQQGAQLFAPTSADKVGGRVALIGPNVTNAGTIQTPDGQTILAAGLQVGLAAHDTNDPTLRGLDVFVGAVTDPSSVIPSYAGTAVNSGLISALRANVTITGKEVKNTGAIESSTSVSLNGRIDLSANYGAASTNGAENVAPFLYRETGTVTLGEGSTARILPERSSAEKVVGTRLALNSKVNITGHAIHFERNASLLAPGADVAVDAGVWNYLPSPTAPESHFVHNSGQIYLSENALLNVAGSADVLVPVSQNFVRAELRAAELADSPLLRTSPLRGQAVIVDIRNTGVYNGKAWVGSPLADVSGYANLIERTAGELTVGGGTVKLNAGGSVVMQSGATVDVSDGWIQYTGTAVQTTRLLTGGRVIDIAAATPDRVYEGIYTGNGKSEFDQWSLTESFLSALGVTGRRTEPGLLFGAAGGTLSISSPGMALDGNLRGISVVGPRQRSQQPKLSELILTIQNEDIIPPHHPLSDTPPAITFNTEGTLPAMSPFALDGAGLPLPLPAERLAAVQLSPSLLGLDGFGTLRVTNGNGDITVPAGVNLEAPVLGTIALTGANVTIGGNLSARGGTIALRATTVSPFEVIRFNGTQNLVESPSRGTLSVSAASTLTTAGLQVDDRLFAEAPVTDPLVINGGGISLSGYHTLLATGSVLDVSGGAAVSPGGRVSYGTGGSLTIRGGQDPAVPSVFGGSLVLGSTMLGYSGVRGASVAITAPAIQVGGTSAPARALLLDPDFFSTGGFTSFALSGPGIPTGTPGQFTPGVFIVPGTQINPVAQNWLADILNPDTQLVLQPILQQEGVRSPVSLSFSAGGVTDLLNSSILLVRGDLIMGEGAVIRTDARASVSFSGQTINFLGEVYAPGGSISVTSSSNSQVLFPGAGANVAGVTTLHLGGQSVLSTAGKTVFTPHVRGYRNGTVLPGGTVSVTGNIAAEAGSLIDVSGATDELDVAPGFVLSSLLDHTSLGGAEVVRTRVDSAGGTISLSGGEQLFVDSTLRGGPGGPGADGGTLTVSSARFINGTLEEPPLVPRLQVKQSAANLPAGGGVIGLPVTGSNGAPMESMGYFTADQFNSSGLGALTLSGSVRFSGPVSLTAQRSLRVATSGILTTESTVHLDAPAVSLGQAFITPFLPQNVQSPFLSNSQTFLFPALGGSGSLTVNAKLIDVGNFSPQGLSTVNLLAPSGDIRGNGNFHIAGSLLMRAGQVYPTTGGAFSITAYDHAGSPGTVTIEGGTPRQLPFSAAGVLSIFAPVIHQNGTLRAPMGTISLGWDGSGTAPKDLISNTGVPVTTQLTLGGGSVTSVSAVDPGTGVSLILPYGLNSGGSAWIDPAGIDITRANPPSKNVTLAGQNVSVQQGSTIDVRGGGDLYSYRWVPGNGGTRDVLSSTTGFAVIPGYSAEYAPYAPFNTSAAVTTLSGDPGYVNSTLAAGDQIFLNAGSGLPAGVYTLLPARYALLPGAFLVSPKSGTPGDTVLNPDKSSVVAGYRFNSSNPGGLNTLLSPWEVAPGTVVRARSAYEDFRATTFFSALAAGTENIVPRLPVDAGRLLLTAARQLAFGGTLTASTPSGVTGARGALVDISSPVDILIAGPGVTGGAGVLTLHAADLSTFSAQSLLIGGVRQTGVNGTTVAVRTNNLTVDNDGAPLSGGDIILVSNGSITLKQNAEIVQTGTGKAETLVLGNGTAGSGNGTLLRLSGDVNARVVRNAITSAAGPALTIGAGVVLDGESLILDSTAATTLDPLAELLSDSINLSSGRISLALGNPGTLQPDAGLVLTGPALQDLQNADNLSFLSYSSLDIYGTGQVGRPAAQSLALHAAQIRGFNNNGGTATFSAQNVLMDNAARGAAPGASGTASGTLAIQAGVIRTGVNQLQVDQFSRMELTATGGILMEGAGGLATSSAAVLTTPLLGGGAGAVQSLRAAGALEITGGGSATVAGGFGARLSLQGGSINNSANIILPSGEITLRATTGDLVAGGRLDTSGTAKQFYDTAKFTDGGSVTLTAEAGNVSIPAGGTVSVAAPAAGGHAGNLTVSAPAGTVNIAGTLAGAGGAGGRSGEASITSGSLVSLAALDALLNAAHFMESRTYRALTGDVAVDGAGRAHRYSVSADRGSISVTGAVDASGVTGGSISLQAGKSVTLSPTARLTTAASKYDSAGKGGSVYLSAGTQRYGVADSSAVLDLQSGSVIDLSVAAAGVTGQTKGTLHLRAPQNTAGTDVQINAIGSTVSGASSISVEGYRVYDLTGSGGAINAAVQTNVKNDGTTFGNAAAAMLSRLFSGSALQSLTSIMPGAELLNRTGDLTLAATWDLSTFRFGPDNATPGVLTMRAAGNLNFDFTRSLTDGFGGGGNTLLWQQPLLAVGNRSWTYHLTAGAAVNAADYRVVQPLPGLTAGKGSLVIGSNGTSLMTLPTGAATGLRDTIITPRWQTIRTGTGDIIVNAGRDVQILNPLGTIYTGGTQAEAMANFDPADTSYQTFSNLGSQQLPFPVPVPQYSFSGGNISLFAQQDIGHFQVIGSGANATLVPDSARQMPTNWLYRRSFIDPVTGQFTPTRNGRDVASTTWWVDFGNFFEGVAALGGGNVSLSAGRDVANVDALIPTNARMPKGTPNASALQEFGGGDLIVRAGRDIDGGVYYVERGSGLLSAGGSIKTNSTRAALTQSQFSALQGSTPDPTTWLPTTLFAGKTAFEVSARGNVQLGQVANAFLMPQGINNSFHLKTWFSTLSENASVTVSSLGGNVTLQGNPAGFGGASLQTWYQNVLRFNNSAGTWGRSQPWLRLVETDTTPFATAASLMPGTLRATAFSGDINLIGSLTLSPSPSGTIDLLAAGAINGMQPNNFEQTFATYGWASSRINLSDTDPSRLPGITAPVNMPGLSTPAGWGNTLLAIMDPVNARFGESGSTTGSFAVLQTKQALHAPGLLHAADTQPLRLYAAAGSISGLTLFGGKAGRVFAGADISDISLYLQNVRPSDMSVVAAGRDIIAYNPNSALRTQAQLPGNILDPGGGFIPVAGDIQINGPGTLQVLAGRHLDLGVGPIRADRTALGLTSIGNARNPALPFEGARIVAGAGLGEGGGTENANLDFNAFITKYVTAPTVIGEDTHYYLTEMLGIGTKTFDEFKSLPAAEQEALIQTKLAEFNALPEAEQELLALDIFYRVLRDTGRGRSKTGDYKTGEEAIATLFKGDAWQGDIALTSRQIKTQSGGDISLFAPGGKLTVGLDSATAQGADQGILTESGGTISIFTHNSVVVGTSRIFTLRGGDEVIWSSIGDIAAGASSKTVASAPPTRVLIDPQSSDVKTDLAGLATGGGIGVLATVAGVAPGNVDLIAPKGTIDAGDAGIRVTGNINIAANNVTNAGNIAAGGTSSGTPSAPSTGGTTTSAPPPPPPQKNEPVKTGDNDKPQPTPPPPVLPDSLISVSVEGFGGGSTTSAPGDPDEEEERRRKEREKKEREEKANQGSPER